MVSESEKLARKILGNKFKKSGSRLEKRCKVVVFIPLEKSDEMIFAMGSAGAGMIGKYRLCSFRTPGVGTFMGGEGTNPAIGTRGNFEMAQEVRLEMICDKENIKAVIDKIFEVHPYEEPAYEVYDIYTAAGRKRKDILEIDLKKSVPVKDILGRINSRLMLTNIPGKMMNKKITKCIFDCSDKDDEAPADAGGKTIYVKKIKENIKAYLI